MRPFRDASFKNKLVALTSLVSIVVAIVACAAQLLTAIQRLVGKRETVET